VKGQHFQAHRIVWLLVTGAWPKGWLDHRDRVRANNRFSNLREVTPTQSNANTTLRSDNAVGMKGVSWKEASRKWQAQIQVRGEKKYLGLFTTPGAAHKAYAKAANEHFGDFGRP
jgi:hypothetical protein